jgi:hypothetical protein
LGWTEKKKFKYQSDTQILIKLIDKLYIASSNEFYEEEFNIIRKFDNFKIELTIWFNKTYWRHFYECYFEINYTILYYFTKF